MKNDIIDKIYVVNEQTDKMKIIRQLIQVRESVFSILDVGEIVSKYKQWKQHLPRVTPYYALKCNGNRAVLKVMSQMGLGFDCSSMGEIQMILDAGASPNRIIFANPTKIPSHIRFAKQKNVLKMTFDSEDELYKIKQLFSSAKLLIRIRSDARKSLFNMGNKHSCDPFVDAPTLLKLARQLELDVIGVAFHVGTGCEDSEAYRLGIAAVYDLFSLGRGLGFNMTLLDIGGGFPSRDGECLNSIIVAINEALDKYFPVSSGVDVIAEPGRYFASSIFTLITRIHSRRMTTDVSTGQNRMMYFIDDGVYSTFNCVMTEHMNAIPIPLINDRSSTTTTMLCSIWGETLDPLDIVVKDAVLPILNVGDWILFENMGAYSSVFATDFCGFSNKPAVINVINERELLFLKDREITITDKLIFDDVCNLLKQT